MAELGLLDGDVKTSLAVSNAKLGKDETAGKRTLKVLTFTLTIKDEACEVEMRIDSETLAVVKHELKPPRQGMSLASDCSAWALDEEMKDDLFVLPKEK